MDIGVSLKELWMLMGEKDVQIYQLLKQVEVLETRVTSLLQELDKLKANGDGNG